MQKYNKGDHVRVAKDLGEFMSHFKSDCEAIVIGSYNDEYGGGNTKSYTIHIKGDCEVSWYYENQLMLIEAGRIDLLEQWEEEEKQESDMKSDLNWIFDHGKEVLLNPHGSTISTLAKSFGLTNLWGSRGEGITYYSNVISTLAMASPFLESGDKKGWLNYCKMINGEQPEVK